MVGAPMVTPDGSGFLIRVANEGTVAVAVESLTFSETSSPLYMRDFLIDVESGYGFPVPTGQPGAGPGDIVRFAPVTIEPNGSQLAELYFADFHLDPLGAPPQADVRGRTFRFRFSDGSVIAVTP